LFHLVCSTPFAADKFMGVTVSVKSWYLCLAFLLLIASSGRAVEYLSGPVAGIVDSGTYVVLDRIEVRYGEVLRIKPGAKFFFAPRAVLRVFGSLVALGTPNNAISFSAIQDLKRDSSFSLDKIEKWQGIHAEGSAPTIRLRYCQIYYADLPVAIESDQTSVDLVFVTFSGPSVVHVRFADERFVAPAVSLIYDSTHSIIEPDHSTFFHHLPQHKVKQVVRTLALRSENITGTRKGVLHPGEYFVNGTLYIAKGDTLSIRGPAIIRFTPRSRVVVDGVLLAKGQKLRKIFFTSYRDEVPYDTIGAEQGDWLGFSSNNPEPEQCLIQMAYTELRYYVSSLGFTNCQVEIENHDNGMPMEAITTGITK